MNTLDYIIKKYKIDLSDKLPIDIPNVGKDDLADLLHELDFKTGVEVGVAQGKYAKKLCEANPQMKVYGVDIWRAYDGYTDYYQEKLDICYEKARELLAPFPNHQIIKDFSMNAVKQFADNSLDFVYIDANHDDPYVTEDIVEWSKKVRSGGIVSGHDYFRRKSRKTMASRYSVIRATQNYTKENNIKPWFLLGLLDKIPGLVRDHIRSWFWVKP